MQRRLSPTVCRTQCPLPYPIPFPSRLSPALTSSGASPFKTKRSIGNNVSSAPPVGPGETRPPNAFPCFHSERHFRQNIVSKFAIVDVAYMLTS